MLPESLVGEKEEYFVFLDGAAETGAEIVALERSLRIEPARGSQNRIEKVPRVQSAIPEELK